MALDFKVGFNNNCSASVQELFHKIIFRKLALNSFSHSVTSRELNLPLGTMNLDKVIPDLLIFSCWWEVSCREHRKKGVFGGPCHAQDDVT